MQVLQAHNGLRNLPKRRQSVLFYDMLILYVFKSESHQRIVCQVQFLCSKCLPIFHLGVFQLNSCEIPRQLIGISYFEFKKL